MKRIQRNVASVLAALLVLACAPSGRPEHSAVQSADIPKQFQGEWRVNLSECPPAITDRPVWINASKIRMDHSVGEVRPTHFADRQHVTLQGKLFSEGDPRLAKLELALSESDNELTISERGHSVKLQRCNEIEASK